jgi:hypothetical protein
VLELSIKTGMTKSPMDINIYMKLNMMNMSTNINTNMNMNMGMNMNTSMDTEMDSNMDWDVVNIHVCILFHFIDMDLDT